MADYIKNIYSVGLGQPYATANEALEEISNALNGGDFVLPSDELADGGQINIVFAGNGLHAPVRIPDDTTAILGMLNRFLVFKRTEFFEDGTPVKTELPVISPNSDLAEGLTDEQLSIGLDLGNNNPNVKIQGIRIKDAVIGIRAGFNCHKLYINRAFITNCLNAQIYIHDLQEAYLTNNIVVGGEYGIIAKGVKKCRVYHNTVFVDGLSTLEGTAKAGLVVQGERMFDNAYPSTAYVLGNLVYSIGCPGVIFYEEDVKSNRLISNYNNIFSNSAVVELRQDNATLSDEDEVVKFSYDNLVDWQASATLGNLSDDFGNPIKIDGNSLSVHPVFISNISTEAIATSIVDLTALGNSPLLGKVPSWFFSSDSDYIPSDFDTDLIAVDSLLENREHPFTAIGANDAVSVNGFFGQDIFTSPLDTGTSKTCDVDPFLGISDQNVDMVYPKLNPGYFYSHERKYYLYAEKGAAQLGYLARSEFALPAKVDVNDEIIVKTRGQEVPSDDWDIIGNKLVVWHRTVGVTSWNDAVELDCSILKWGDTSFRKQKAFYVFRLKDGETRYQLPEKFKTSGPVVITDDRVSYLDPEKIVRRSFSVDFDDTAQASFVNFHGTKNLIENPQFDDSPGGGYPSKWLIETGGSAFVVDRSWAYIGERAVGLPIGTGNGTLLSPKFPVASGDALTVSWHASLPIHMSGASGVLHDYNVDYRVDFYDHMNNLLQSDEGIFEVSDKDYKRYYVTYGPSDIDVPDNIQSFDVDTTGLTNSIGQVPLNSSYAKLGVKAFMNSGYGDDAFVLFDAAMAEHSPVPTVYHQEPDLKNMTVEYETSDNGTFIDKRMNLSPVYNENPNGFLYITDMPARIWGGPDGIETTTLHEYRWPEGRIMHLPWARLIGKDKLHYTNIEHEEAVPPIPIIEPVEIAKRAVDANMSPSVVRSSQDSKHYEGLSIHVLDNVGNPFPLRNFTISLLEEHDNFPGYLSKRYLGAKEQLGTVVYGSLNENGAANVAYTPPPASLIRYVGSVPSILSTNPGISGDTDAISYIDTNYDVSLENNGNITVFGLSGFIPTASSTHISGNYVSVSDQEVGTHISLEYPPVVGSVSIYASGSAFEETYLQPSRQEFIVDYPNAQIIFDESRPAEELVNISYKPKYAYPDPAKPDTIIFHHDHVFGNYTGPIQVDYDAQMYLEVTIQQIVTGEYVTTFPIVAQNPKLGQIAKASTNLEY